MRDDLWSFVSCRGFLAEGEMGIHPVWKAAVETGSVLNVPMKELLKLKKCLACERKKVWIVENSSVCSTIVDEVPVAPVICTHGQFRAASWVLLDLLVAIRLLTFLFRRPRPGRNHDGSTIKRPLSASGYFLENGL